SRRSTERLQSQRASFGTSFSLYYLLCIGKHLEVELRSIGVTGRDLILSDAENPRSISMLSLNILHLLQQLRHLTRPSFGPSGVHAQSAPYFRMNYSVSNHSVCSTCLALFCALVCACASSICCWVSVSTAFWPIC